MRWETSRPDETITMPTADIGVAAFRSDVTGKSPLLRGGRATPELTKPDGAVHVAPLSLSPPSLRSPLQPTSAGGGGVLPASSRRRTTPMSRRISRW
jgi:hypothetical protein